MRFMVIVKATADTEAGVMPSTSCSTAMGKYNEELVKAGVMLAGEGLHPSSKGARVRFSRTADHRHRRPVRRDEGADRRLLDPAGQVAWRRRSSGSRRCPNPTGEESEIEIRQVFEAEDFGDELTPELREQEERLRARGRANAAAAAGVGGARRRPDAHRAIDASGGSSPPG